VPEVIIIAGPNGAGKTTFAIEYVLERRKHLDFVNADEIAREVNRAGLPQLRAETRAARNMLERIDNLVRSGTDFMFETTLATLTYAHKIPVWRQSGYVISLIYLRLPSVETSIVRVNRRIEAGGHGIPEKIIRRRFDKSTAYLNDIYKPIVDEWYIWDSLEGSFALAQSWDQS
jgi:predicted ABC-type ATPase